MSHQGQQEQVDRYFEQQSSTYAEGTEKGLWRRCKEKEYAVVLDHIVPLEGQRILEVGCGSGWYAKRLVRHGPRRYVATDRSQSLVEAIQIPGVVPLVADLCQLPFPPASYDRILCAGALEFVPDPKRFFVECSRVLNPGGRIVVLVPTANFVGWLYLFWHLRHGFRVHLFSEKALADMASSEGLTVTRVTRTALFGLVATLEMKQ